MGRASLTFLLVLSATAAFPLDARARHGAQPFVPGGSQEGVERYDVTPDGSSFEATIGPVGDVNGDGVEDLGAIAGTYGTERVRVVFGRRPGGPAPPVPGFDVDAPAARYAIAGAGDTNADGLGDVAFGTSDGVTVVYGKRDAATVRTDELRTRGFSSHTRRR